MKKVLVINLGWEQRPLIEKLASLGVRLFGVHYNHTIDLAHLFEKTKIADLRDLESILTFADEIKPDAVISDQCDYSHFAQAMVAEKLSLFGPPIAHAQISANKLLQRQKALATGVKVPHFGLIANFSDACAFSEREGFPIILKPIDNRGSFGVSKVASREAMKWAYEKAVVNSHSRLVIAEQFIEGTEITVDGYVFSDGPVSLSLAKKGHVNNETRVAIDIKYPGEFEDTVYEKVMRNNEFVIRQLGYSFGMTHAEYMLAKDGEVYLIEAANRGGGVFTSEIIAPQVSGVDILSIYVTDCLNGLSGKRPSFVARNPVILKFFSFPPGKIVAIQGLEKVRVDADVLEHRLAVKVGDTIHPITTDANRHGFVIVKSCGDVRKKADDVIRRISIVYE